jgi:hypothetical protein
VVLVLWGGWLARQQWPRTIWVGSVVDGSTGLPISGATVSLVWGTKWLIQMDGGEDFLSAVETVTDENGHFAISSTPRVVLNPFRGIGRAPTALILKDGYSVGDGVKLMYGTSDGWTFEPKISLSPCTSSNTRVSWPPNEFPYLILCRGPTGIWCTPPDQAPLLSRAIHERSTPYCH